MSSKRYGLMQTNDRLTTPPATHPTGGEMLADYLAAMRYIAARYPRRP